MRRLLPLVLSAFLALALPAVASAITITPTTFLDPVGGTCVPGTSCSLRQAVDFEVTPGDVKLIVLQAGRYELTNGALQVFQNGDQSSAFTIQGGGARATTIDGNGLGVIHVVEGSDATINDVTITGGNAGTSSGGGIDIDGAAALTLNRSTVTGNRAKLGAGISAAGTLNAAASTVSANTANPGASGTDQAGGGGLYVTGTANLTNVTVSGNTAHTVDGLPSRGGGIYVNNGTLSTQNVTIAGNSADAGGGIWSTSGGAALASTIVSGNTPATCVGTPFSGDHNLTTDACGFPSANPLLGALAANGGPTNTRALSPGSPAIDGGAGCPATDQRGFARVGPCDIGAYEYRPPRLAVVTRVVNSSGGIASADDFSVHVRAGGTDVADSPQPGSTTGRTYTLTPGTYSVGEDTDKLYTASFSGDCSATGAVALAEGQAKTCVLTNDDKTPKKGSINAEPSGGTVKVKTGGKFRVLREGEQLKSGTVVDTTKGRITLIASSGKKAVFFDGIFKLVQPKKGKITTLELVEKLTGCKTSKGKASAAAKKKKKRRLWGDGKGKFRTKGQYSSATVRGTRWLVEDTCSTTLTRVKRGKVEVRDFAKKKTVLVKAGKRYIARKP